MVPSASITGQSQTVTGDGEYDASYTLPTNATAAGTYVWHAVYAPDGNNQATDDTKSQLSSEQTVVSPASPKLVTTANPSGTAFAGTTAPTLSDSAVLSGGYYPTGTAPGAGITFNLYLAAGNNLQGTLIYTKTVSVTGDGTYTASTSAETQQGLYTWVVTYSGDGNNKLAADTGFNGSGTGAEQVTVSDVVSKNEAATLGYWANNNGQKLLQSYKGTGAASLGTWLATAYPNLFGNLAGDTGAQIAAYYVKVKAAASGVTWNTYGQALTTALGVYVTTTNAGWGSTAASFGFQQGWGGAGLGSVYYNVGGNGASFGVANNTYVTVNALLTYLNGVTHRTGGTTTALPTALYFYTPTDTTLSNGANSVLSGLTNLGDIT